MRLLMLGEAERRRLVSLQIVTAVAGVEVRGGRKLPLVLVGVAVGAALELDFEQRVFSLWNMALCTFQPRMLASQRISAAGMLLHRECRRLPTVYGMTGGALHPVRTLGKLPVMRIRLMAVHTLLKCQRLLKIPIGVALCTPDA